MLPTFEATKNEAQQLRPYQTIESQGVVWYTRSSSINKTTHESATNTNVGLTVQGRVSSMSATTDSTPDLPTKQCTKCGATHPADPAFWHKDKNRKDGLSPWCKTCNSKNAKNWKKNNPERKRELNRAWVKANPEKQKESNDRWAAKNPEKLRAKARRWYAAHPEQCRTRSKQWRVANPSKVILQKHRRRALKLHVEGAGIPFDAQAQLKRQHGKCYYCQCKLTEYHIDHVIPLTRGGSDHPDNKVLACPSCNLKKYNRLPHEWTKGGRLL